MNLTKTPAMVNWPETHYVFLEKVGPFMETAKQCWNEMFRHIDELKAGNQITGFISLYKFKPDTYRAGVSMAAKPAKVPQGMAYEHFKGGKYGKFVLTGSYNQLPEACEQVFMKYIPEQKIQMAQGWCIENYVNDPQVTPEKDLLTEILIPLT